MYLYGNTDELHRNSVIVNWINPEKPEEKRYRYH